VTYERLGLLLLLGALGGSCRSVATANDSPVPLSLSAPLRDLTDIPGSDAALSSTLPAPARLAPLAGYPWMLTLSEAPAGKDVATPPLGTTQKRPIIVAVHGAADRPEWACGGWRIGVEAYPFVVCPGGLPMGQETYAWAGTKSIAAAVDRALNALRDQFGQYCLEGSMIYAGFSQGAILAAPYLIENANRFPVAVLGEGGYGFTASDGFAQGYYKAGGRRIMLLCGTRWCTAHAHRARRTLERAGLRVVVAGDPQAGHNLNGAMQQAIRDHWHELVAGLAGWETYPANRWPR